MVVEAPGEQEALEGEPLVGGSGSILRGTRIKDARTGEVRRYGGLLAQAGEDQGRVSFINTLQCRPPNNVYPTDSAARNYISATDANKAVAHCMRAHVLPVLRDRSWERVDLLGEKAFRIIVGRTQGVLAWRGSPFTVSLDELATRFGVDGGPGPVHAGSNSAVFSNLRCLPTLDPVALMRNQSLFPAAVNDLKKSITPPPEYYTLHPTLEEVEAFEATEFAFDIETDYPRTDAITMVGLCAAMGKSIVVPFRGPYKRALEKIFKRAKILVGHNAINFDIPHLQKHGIEFDPEVLNSGVYDTMLMQHLVQPDMPHDLTFVGSIFTSKPTWEFEKRRDEELYCARDVDVTWQAYKQLVPLLKMEQLMNLYKLVQVPLARICKLMHNTGVKVEPERIERVREQLLKEMAELELKLPDKLRTTYLPTRKRVLAPPGTMSPPKYGKKGQLLKQKPVRFLFEPDKKKVVSWRSPAVIAEWLYNECKIPEEKDIKSGNTTTGKIALAKIARRLQNGTYKLDNIDVVHRAVVALQRLRKLDELETTFVPGSLAKVGKIHTNFNVHGTNSGRLSSSDPNLQNIPSGTRCIYVPSVPGWKIIEVDYSGIENRLTALFANDTERLHRFNSIPDFSEHRWATEVFFGIPYADVEKDNSREAPYGRSKAIVHGTNYGEGPRKIALLNDIPENGPDGTRALLLKWKQAIPKTIAWQERTGKQAAKDGVLATPFKRKRWFWGSSMYTESLSFLPQSSAADVMFRAMIALMYERIGWPLEFVQQICEVCVPLPEPANLLLQVHDSLVFECPSEMVDVCVKVIKTVLEQPFREFGGYQFPIEVKVGESWGELKSYKGEGNV